MAYEELKDRQSRMWGSGEYQQVTDTIADVHALVIERLVPGPGVRWLDVACGTGAVAELAARAGADVTGVDLAPALIEVAQGRADEQGLAIDYRVGDCEALELPDASFDVVSSTCGVMFAPDHDATARELARVTKPGGRLGIANWTPEGGLGRMFKMMAPFQPAPPPSNPFLWGQEAHVRELLGASFDLAFAEHTSTLEIESGEAYWELFSMNYGPTKVLAESLGDRREEMHRAWVEFFEREYSAPNGGISHPRELLLTLGTRSID